MSQQNAIAKMGWREFEQFIARLFEALGYVNIQLTSDIGDEGKDIELELSIPMGGTMKFLVECKHWQKTAVGRPVVQKLHSAVVTDPTVDGGIIVTSGRFTSGAVEYAGKTGIKLVDGDELYRLARSKEIELDGSAVLAKSDYHDRPEAYSVRRKIRYWKIAPGKGGMYWNDFKELGFVAIFWQGVGDLRRFRSWGEIEDFIRRKKETPGSGWETARVEYNCDQLWWFGHKMQVGDIVFAYSRKTILGVGRIVGEYEFEKDDDLDFHYRPIEWIELDSKSVSNLPRDLQKKLKQQVTIIDLSEREGQQIMALYEPKWNLVN